MKHEETPVLIIGAGPVGLALAGDLGWRGIRSILVEARGDTVFQPKMDMVGIRTMEICRRWGITDDVRTAGYNRDFPQDNAWVVDLQTYEFGREAFPAPAAASPPPTSPEHRERCPQNFFDPVLQKFVRSSGMTDVRYRTELIDFDDTGDGILARIRDKQTGAVSTIAARFIVGCDGGDSAVRTQLGIPMSGEGALTYTTNAIIKCPDLHRLNRMERAYRYIFIGEEGTWATLVAIDGYDNWRFSLIGDKEQREVSDTEMRQAFLRAVGTDVDFEILSTLPWVRRQLVADSYRSGNAFLAGDSAHLTSPTGGFGMNTGILDAVNLSWKLAAVLEGWGGDELLDSYAFEQRPVAIRNVTEAGENLKRMLTPRFTDPDPIMFTSDSAEAETVRRDFGQAYTDAMSREWNTTGIHLGYVYEGSPIIASDGSAMPRPQVSSYEPNARPGARAPHVWLQDGRSTLDLLGRSFVLFRFSADAPTDGIEEAALAAGVPLRVVDLDDREAAALYGRKLVLVRPDGHVSWRADEAPQDAAALLRTVVGAVPVGAEAVGVAA
jgi:2-polyprenyl-6-methoxyphenol hydroxylase-like FAD-dependent oxidoreductase